MTKEEFIKLRKLGFSIDEIVGLEERGELPKNKSIGRKIIDLLTQSEQRFGQTLGSAASVVSPNIKAEREAIIEQRQRQSQNYLKIAKRETDPERKKRFLNAAAEAAKTEGYDIFNDPEYQKTAKQIFGEGLGVAADIAGAGTFGKSAQGLKSFKLGKATIPSIAGGAVSQGFKSGLIQGAKTGAKAGTVFGATQGATRSMQEDEELSKIIGKGFAGGMTGGVFGGAIGGITGGISGKIKETKALRELAKTSDEADAKLVRLTRQGTKDRTAIKAIKQGLDEADVMAIKTATKADKQKMNKMLDLAKRAEKNRKVIKRPMDIAGESIIEPAKSLAKKLKKFYAKLDDVANSLKGKTVKKIDDLLQSIDDDILNTGAKIKKQRIDFSGSDFEDVGGVENIINNVYRRLKKSADAHDLHRLKRYIDNNVDYGKTSQGLTGQAERLLKSWRKTIDNVLDTQFSNYNKVNTNLSKILNQFDDLASSFGRKFNINKPLSNIRAGQVASRILSKSPNRGEILNSVTKLQKLAKEFGFKGNEDIINQVLFADLLEKIFGTQATQGFQGQISRAIGGELINQAKSGQVGIGELGVKLGAEALESFRGITPEKQIEILSKLIN